MNEITTVELIKAACTIVATCGVARIGYNIYKKDEVSRKELAVAGCASGLCLLIAGLGFYETTNELEWQRNDDPKTAVCVDMKKDSTYHQFYFDADNNPKTIEYTGKVENTLPNNARLKKRDVKIGKSMSVRQWREFVRMERVHKI